MKKKILIITIIFASLLMILLVVILWFKPIIELGISQNNSAETFLLSSLSPDGEYKLDAYKTEPGATVDFSIKVYITNESDKALIYNAYHEYQVEIIWINKNTVSINGKKLDLSKGETYDWRITQSY